MLPGALVFAECPAVVRVLVCRLHWLVMNVPASGNISDGADEVVPYMGPAPPEGVHRYVFSLFKQPSAKMPVCSKLLLALECRERLSCLMQLTGAAARCPKRRAGPSSTHGHLQLSTTLATLPP